MDIPAQHCALICMEMQRGTIGDCSPIAALVTAAREQRIVEHVAGLLPVARMHAIPVIHCTAEFRHDRRGSQLSAPILAQMAAISGHIESGSEAAEIVPELGPEPADFVISRLHGVSPFSGTSLDITLRNLQVDTVMLAGVSLNLGVLGLAIEAVNRGYRVIILEDAVTGIPESYVADVKRFTLRHIAQFASCQDLAARWSSGGTE